MPIIAIGLSTAARVRRATIATLTWRGSARWNPTDGHLIEFGAQAQSLSASASTAVSTTRPQVLVVDSVSDAWSAAGWAHYRWTPNTRFSITPGARLEHWQLFDQTKASPWLLTEFEVRVRHALRFGAAIQHQSATLDNAMFVPPRHELVPQRAATIEAGIEQRIGAARSASISAGYHRREDDALRLVNAEVRIVNDRVVLPANPHWANALTGKRRRRRSPLERRAVNGLNGWLSYTWNDSHYDDPVTGGHPPESFPSDFDQRHTVNSYVAYRWGGRTSLSARMRYGSNFPIAGYIGEDANGYVMSDAAQWHSPAGVRAARSARRSRLHLSQEPADAVHRGRQRDQPRQLSAERARHEHRHAAGLRSDRDDVSAVAGRGSVDRILNLEISTYGHGAAV